MSHFSVAVLSYSPDDVEDLLAPYYEGTENPDELQFFPADESIDNLRADFDKHSDKYENYEDFLSSEYGYMINGQTGEVGYECNPNAKWDWWSIGGRWSGMLKLKQGCTGNYCEQSFSDNHEPTQEGYCDQALLKDVLLTEDAKAYSKAIRFWEITVEGQQLHDGEEPEQYRSLHKSEYYVDQFGDKETYARSICEFNTWAFVTPDGDWHENGQMGWFAMNDATNNSRKAYASVWSEALANADPDLWITIVDCHI